MSSKNCTSSGAPCISAWARVTARAPRPEPGSSCPLSADLPCSCPRGGLLVEVEVAWRTLLEPEPVVVRRVLQELGRLLEHVVFLRPSLRIALGGFSLPPPVRFPPPLRGPPREGIPAEAPPTGVPPRHL